LSARKIGVSMLLEMRRSNGGLASWSLNDNGRSIEIAVSGTFIATTFTPMLGLQSKVWVLRTVPHRSPRCRDDGENGPSAEQFGR